MATIDLDWRVRGTYFEACNCDAICPCRSVHGAPGGPSSYGECFGSLSWHVIDGYLHVESEGDASDAGDVRCGIPGYDHPGTELYNDILRSNDETMRWEIMGKRNASFASDFDYRSDARSF